MADISKIKLPDGNTYDVKDASKSSATNWVNGSQIGSVRTVNSAAEDDDYTIGQYAVTEGCRTKASGDYSHAEGYYTKASGDYSHAEGSGTIADGSHSHAEGGSTKADGIYSHAEGVNTQASGSRSHAEGYYTIANHFAQHVFGQYNIADDSTAAATSRGNYIEIVGNGTGTSARSNARTLDWSGNEVLAGKLTVGIAGTNSLDVATIGQLPTKTSDLTNDSGFITSDSDEKLRTEILNSGFMYLIGGSEYSTASIKYIHKGLSYQMSSNTGILGIGSNTDGYEGAIRLYGSTSNTRIHIKHEATANRTITLPDKTGTVALTSDIPDVSGFITSETDPVFSASAAYGISTTDIANWNGKQAALVSGTNIKTVNGNSLLGSGDVTITETDPTVPSWAKASTKPSYTASEINGLLDFFYPVGSYYETSDTTFDPNVSWGGTWVLETEGQVHVSSGSNYTINGATTNTSDGGSPYIQEHTHSHTNPTVTVDAHGITQPVFTLPNHQHHFNNNRKVPGIDNSASWASYKVSSGSSTSGYFISRGTNTLYTVVQTDDPDSNPNCTRTTNVSLTNNHKTNVSGGGVGNINTSGLSKGNAGNMQPYIIVNRWHRTA